MRKILSAAVAATLMGAAPAFGSEIEPGPPNALTAFGGWATDNDWGDFVLSPWDLSFSDAQVVGVAYSRRVWTPYERVSVEIEAQATKWFGDQDHWEFNLPVAVVRWRPLAAFDASVAFGLGLSLAAETPALEAAQEGDSEAVMTYWAFEVETATPVENLRLVGRLHHRSTAFGTFGDEGGLNSLVIGLRRRF